MLFAVQAAVRAPVPAVNEPHYLTKARHFYDPQWCAGDLFLESSNAHWTFYATLGWLTRFLSFEQTAWVGRVVAWVLLACAWTLLARLVANHGARRANPDSAAPPAWSAAIYLGISALGTLSGEWLIGGVEAKCFAYAFLFAGIASFAQTRWLGAASLLGLAVSFHPIVGGWGIVALAVGWAWRTGRSFAQSARALPADQASRRESVEPSPSRGQFVLALIVFAACSAPGLVPALDLLGSAPADKSREAARIQVYDRLDHHLNPAAFSSSGYALYAGLCIVWLVLSALPRKGGTAGLFDRVVAGSLGIACLGLAASQTPWALAILKFYPFRLFDVLLPLAVSMKAAQWLARVRFLQGAAGWVAAGLAMLPVWVMPAPDRHLVRGPPEYRADWRDACLWARDHAPRDALFLTPKYLPGFKWLAERPEYATWKDCPQDAPSLLEWKRRLDWVRDWRQRHFAAGFSQEALAELRRETGVAFVLAKASDPYQIPPVFRNPSFAIYELR